MITEKKGAEVPKTKVSEVNAIDEMKKLLDEQLKKFANLKEKISFRDRFMTTQTRLKDFAESLKKEKAKNSPETDVFYIKLCSKLSYREEEAISVNNINLIEEFLNFINAKIAVKVSELEKEIVM